MSSDNVFCPLVSSLLFLFEFSVARSLQRTSQAPPPPIPTKTGEHKNTHSIYFTHSQSESL